MSCKRGAGAFAGIAARNHIIWCAISKPKVLSSEETLENVLLTRLSLDQRWTIEGEKRTSLMRSRSGAIATLVYVLLALTGANAQTYPDKPITLISSVAPGGSADLVARTIGARLSESLGQPVVIESRPGAAGQLAIDAVLRAPADGYTLLSSPNGPISVAPHLRRARYERLEGLTPVAMLAFVGVGIGVNASLPIRNISDLVNAAKANPEGLSYGHSGTGNAMHLAGELLKNMTGANLVAVPYRGTSAVATAILAGEVPCGIADLTSLMPQAAAGKVRVLAVINSTPIAIAPDVPIVAQYLPGYAADPWIGMFALPGTAPDIVNRLNAEVGVALARADVRATLVRAGLQPVPMTPDIMRRFVDDDIAKWGGLIGSINLKGG
jgi:tripartite-type tricarboxylate transporter receptor subunit TctC